MVFTYTAVYSELKPDLSRIYDHIQHDEYVELYNQTLTVKKEPIYNRENLLNTAYKHNLQRKIERISIMKNKPFL
jgi:hypothetical protein